jgi:hypothetical protein
MNSDRVRRSNRARDEVAEGHRYFATSSLVKAVDAVTRKLSLRLSPQRGDRAVGECVTTEGFMRWLL